VTSSWVFYSSAVTRCTVQ